MHGPAGDPSRFARDLPSPVPAHPIDALLTPERARKYRQVLARRTGRLAVVVEDCFDPHNATAIIRTCDAFGIHRVLVVTGRNAFKVNRQVSQGTHHYIALEVFPDIAPAYARLRADGFRILVSDLGAGAAAGPQLLADDLARQPLALVFGNEGHGVTRAAAEGADGSFLIPMRGFCQSLNLSVSVAVSLYALRGRALSEDLAGDLPAAEQAACYDRWVREHKGHVADAVLARETGRHGEDLDSLRAGAPGP